MLDALVGEALHDKGLFCALRSAHMKIIHRLPLACVASLLLATSACRSSRGPDVIVRPSPRDASPKEEIALITADSLVFAAVVRGSSASEIRRLAARW